MSDFVHCREEVDCWQPFSTRMSESRLSSFSVTKRTTHWLTRIAEVRKLKTVWRIRVQPVCCGVEALILKTRVTPVKSPITKWPHAVQLSLLRIVFPACRSCATCVDRLCFFFPSSSLFSVTTVNAQRNERNGVQIFSFWSDSMSSLVHGN